MAGCIQHNFRRCSSKEQTCSACCAQEAECGAYYYTPINGAVNNIQVGDQLWLANTCSGEAAPDGIYTDCGPKGSCSQPDGETRIYGCVTVASGVVTAIAACSGDVSCGSGAGDAPSSCSQSSTIQTNTKHEWTGRQKITVSALDTWETLYESTTGFDTTVTNIETGTLCYTANNRKKECYLKQIYIQNCDKGGTNDKKFSVRIYNADTGTRVISDCTLTSTTIPAEMSLADRIKLSDNERIKLLEHESPLKLNANDIVQIQAHTSVEGWIISGWFEETSQNWDEPISTQITNIQANAGVGNIGAMQGLSKKLGKRNTDRRFKPGAASTSGEG
tara:strand:- start:453 stop:1451 length:999 start_codon:yes stop_codon:yes gene_type:complete